MTEAPAASAPAGTGGRDPLVLLPGMGCTAALWSRLAFAEPPITPVLDEASLEGQVDRLLAELPPRFALAGLSLGAIVAMALIRRDPARVSRLCLMSTNARPPTQAQRAAWASQAEIVRGGTARDLQRSLLPSLLSPDVIESRPELVELTLAMADALGSATYLKQLALQGTRADERLELDRIRVPTLVVAAERDLLCGLDRHREIADRIPGADLVVVKGAAHLSPLEQPGAVSKWLARWVASAD